MTDIQHCSQFQMYVFDIVQWCGWTCFHNDGNMWFQHYDLLFWHKESFMFYSLVAGFVITWSTPQSTWSYDLKKEYFFNHINIHFFYIAQSNVFFLCGWSSWSPLMKPIPSLVSRTTKNCPKSCPIMILNLICLSLTRGFFWLCISVWGTGRESNDHWVEPSCSW